MAGRIPDTVLDEISRRIDIVNEVEAYVSLSHKGGRWWGLCPFHNERTPSFTVSRDTNLFYCFGCQKGGGIYQFVMEMEGLSFLESVRRLAEKAGVDVPESGETPGDRGSRRALEELYQRVSGTFRWLLLNHPGASSAREYLENRGIDSQTADAYRIGWAPAEGEWLYNFLIGKEYSVDFLAESGLFSRQSPRWAFFVDRLMFPVMPDDQRVVAFSGRSLNEKGPKYKNSPETPIYRKSRELYGLAQARGSIRENKRAILCEGNLDVLACAQAGLGETVAPLGTAFTEEHAKQLKRRSENLVLAFDGDAPGRAAVMKAAVTAEGTGLTVAVVNMPSGSDPADILEKNGGDALKKTFSGPINIFDYLLDSHIRDGGALSGDAREEALKELTPFLNAVDSDVRREAYLKSLAERINADPKAVMREYVRSSRYGAPMGGSRRDVSRVNGEEVPFIGDELYMMIAVAVKTEYFSFLRSMLAPELLRDRRALSIYRVMDDLSMDGTIPRTDHVTAHVAQIDGALAGLIIEKASTELFDQKAQETIREKIRSIRIRTLTEESRELVRIMAKDSDGDAERNEARMKRISEINGEIMKIRQGEDGAFQI